MKVLISHTFKLWAMITDKKDVSTLENRETNRDARFLEELVAISEDDDFKFNTETKREVQKALGLNENIGNKVLGKLKKAGLIRSLEGVGHYEVIME